MEVGLASWPRGGEAGGGRRLLAEAALIRMRC